MQCTHSLVLNPISGFKGAIFDRLGLIILHKKDVFPYCLLNSLEIDPVGRTVRLVTQTRNSKAVFAFLPVYFEASTPPAAFSKPRDPSLLSMQSMALCRVPVLP